MMRFYSVYSQYFQHAIHAFAQVVDTHAEPDEDELDPWDKLIQRMKKGSLAHGHMGRQATLGGPGSGSPEAGGGAPTPPAGLNERRRSISPFELRRQSQDFNTRRKSTGFALHLRPTPGPGQPQPPGGSVRFSERR